MYPPLYDEPDFYDEPPDEPPYLWRDEGSWQRPEPDRLTHLVMIDGRLVDMWSEPATGSQWEMIANRIDAQQARWDSPRRPAEPRPEPYDEMLDWLDSLVGGRVALEQLADTPLPPTDARALLAGLELPSRHRLEAVTHVLETVIERRFDDELGTALIRGLATVWQAEPETVLRAKSATHVAGGLLWAICKANDIFGNGKDLTQTMLRTDLGTTTPISTRRRLIRWRDQAYAARDTHLASEKAKAAVLP